MANLREAQKRMTRRLLLEAGLELFKAKGYAATTVDDIATAAGTTRVTFYAYFSSRSELMKALIDEQLNDVLQRVGSPSTAPRRRTSWPPSSTGLRRRSRRGCGGPRRAGRMIRPIIRLGRDAAVIEPELTDLVEQWMAEAISDIEDGLETAGRFQPHQRYFRGVLAMAQLDFVAQNWEGADWKLTRDQMLEELAASWVGLLTA